MWTKRINFWLIGIVLLLSGGFSRLAAYALLNQANLAHLRGESTITLYQKAMKLAADDIHIRWQMVRASLDANNYVIATEAIAPITRFTLTSSLFFADVLRILEATGQSDQVINLYNENRDLNQSTMVSDTVALAYIAQRRIDQALEFRPTDLYLNSHLWQREQGQRNPTTIDNIHEKLVYFPFSSIDPVNERVLKYTGKAILCLLENKLWMREDAIYATDYLIWQHYHEPEVEQIVSNLRARYPIDSAWSTLESELIQRRAKMHVSESLLSKSSKNESSKNLVQSTHLNNWNHSIAAKENVFWQWSAWQGKDHEGALFSGGPDPFESNSALRIMNLWLRPSSGYEVQPYAEFVSEPLMLEQNTVYNLAFRYKTDEIGKAIAFIALLDYAPTSRFSFAHTALPDTAASWQNWKISGRSYSESIEVRLLLRMLGTGSVWFDDVQLVKGDK